MARIAKDPEIRRNELIETAEELFLTKGFEKTLVSDIVKKLGVAQGTFYYYFKSKDEVMVAILDKMWSEYASEAAKAGEMTKTDPYQRLRNVFQHLFSNQNTGDERLQLFNKVEDESTAVKFHNYSDMARTKHFGPIIQQLVREGMEAGIFNSMQYPDEITEIIFMGVNTYMHTYFPYFGDFEFFKRKMAALEELFEKILGLEKGSFKLTN